MNITDQLLAKYPVISDQVDAKELGALLRELEIVLQSSATGNVVEFGCYVGTTSLFMLPTVHKGWFADFAPDDVPESIIFAFFDGDFYESIVDSFRVCDGKFQKTATIIVDDYANEALPGAARAVDEWLKRHPARVTVESSLAIIRR